MKVNSLKIDVTALKPALGSGVRVEDIKTDLLEEGAIVRGYRDGATVVMVIDGDVEVETVEAVFDEYGVNLDDYIIDDTIPSYDDVDADDDVEIPAYDDVEDVEVFDNDNCEGDDCDINEKKGSCCPKKKVNMISLSEVFHSARKGHKKTLDEVIDHMSGKSVSASVAETAIAKAKLSAKVQMIRENLGEERFARISKALNEGKDSAYENTKINGKAVSEYKLEELEALKKKCDEKLKKLTECGDAGKKTEECKKLEKLAEILEDEISYRKAKDVAENSGLELKSLNPNDVKKVDEADDDEDKKDDAEDSEDNGDEEKKDGDNPDEDEEVEIGSIIVTLASKDAAEDLKQDLVDAGVPEDVIEIEPVEDEKEESDEETEEESDSDEEKAEAEKPEESVKHRGKRLNEADDDEEKSDDDNADEESEDEGSEDETETPDGAFKLILTDTDYVNELSDVLENIWGMEHSEFEELIGGEVVAADDSDDGEDNGDEESDAEDADDMDFDPDEIFKDL